MLGNLPFIRPPPTCPFLGKAFETFFQEIEMEPLTDMIYPNYADLDLLFKSDELNSFIYFGSSTEASYLGAKAGDNIKPFLAECSHDSLMLLTQSGDIDAFFNSLVVARGNSLGPKYSKTLRIWVHESRYDEISKKIDGFFGEIGSGIKNIFFISFYY